MHHGHACMGPAQFEVRARSNPVIGLYGIWPGTLVEHAWHGKIPYGPQSGPLSGHRILPLQENQTLSWLAREHDCVFVYPAGTPGASTQKLICVPRAQAKVLLLFRFWEQSQANLLWLGQPKLLSTNSGSRLHQHLVLQYRAHSIVLQWDSSRGIRG